MKIPKLLTLLCCMYYSYASHHHSHNIPVEGYESKLENLGQHVDLSETPVKVIKITKTVAVKVPVPYPVKVIQKVPYPVHVSKPYPVPVPQIVHVPAPTHKHGGAHDASSQDNAYDSPYQVHEGHDSTDGHSFGPLNEHSFGGGNEHSFVGGNSGHNQNIESFASEYPQSEGSHDGSSYDAPSHSSYYGNNGNQDGSNSLESKNYDQAIQEYLQKVNAASASHGSGGAGGHYH